MLVRFLADCRFGRGRSYALSLRRERLDVEEATLNEGTVTQSVRATPLEESRTFLAMRSTSDERQEAA